MKVLLISKISGSWQNVYLPFLVAIEIILRAASHLFDKFILDQVPKANFQIGVNLTYASSESIRIFFTVVCMSLYVSCVSLLLIFLFLN